MTGPRGERCAECYFYGSHEAAHEGFCYRHPPSVDEHNDGTMIPITVFDDGWCGEFKPIDHHTKQQRQNLIERNKISGGPE